VWTTEDIGHDEALARIASSRFSATKYEITTNPNRQKNGVVFYRRGRIEARAYPDILVVDRQSKNLAALGEVEIADSVDAEEAQQWKLYGELHDCFYLYVPAGSERKAVSLIREYGIRVLLRRFYDTRGGFVVEEVL
jgi:hypothetical protein